MAETKVDLRNASCPMGEIQVDCRGQSCPVPLVEVRKALKKAKPGEIIEVVGSHPPSRKEIPMAVAALNAELLSVDGPDNDWKIRIRR